METLFFGLLLFLAGFLVPRDAFPWMQRLSAWLMRNRDNTTLAYVVFVVAFLILCVLVGTGCTSEPVKGGGASVNQSAVNPTAAPQISTPQPDASGMPTGVPSATLSQPESPQGQSSQDLTFERTVTIETPQDVVDRTITEYPDGRRIIVEKPRPAGTIITDHAKQGARQEIGGSFFDKSKAFVEAQWKQYGKLQFIGVAVLLAAAAAYFYPPLKLVLGAGKQFPAIVAVIGAGLIIAPMLIAGNEGKILLGAVIVGCGAWLVIRLTRKEAEADLNKNGVPDRLEPDHLS